MKERIFVYCYLFIFVIAKSVFYSLFYVGCRATLMARQISAVENDRRQ